MKNFTRTHDGVYRYRTADAGEVIALEVYYYKSSYVERRGVSVHVMPQTIKDGLMSTVLLSGYTVLAQRTARKSDKAVAGIAARLDAHVPEIARLFETGQKAESQALLKSVLAAAERAA